MIVLDGIKMVSREALHLELKDKLELPDYYGANLDALWDCLTGWVDLPLQVEWKHFDTAEKKLGAYATQTLDIFKAADDIQISCSD